MEPLNRALPRVVLAPPGEVVAAFLADDPLRGAYALGYLTPPWHDAVHAALAVDAAGAPVALVVRHDERPQPALLVFGAARALIALLSDPAFASWRTELRRTGQDIWLTGQPEELEALAGFFYPLERRTLERHVGDAATLRVPAGPSRRRGGDAACTGRPLPSGGRFSAPDDPADSGDDAKGQYAVRLLTCADAPPLNRLYGLQDDDTFAGEELARNAYVGALAAGLDRHGGRCIAAAGTHVTAPAQGIAAIGNVYTAPAWRGQGWATACVAQLCAYHLAHGYGRIVLNVDAHNAPARAVYHRLGFRYHCTYAEVRAVAL